MVTWARNFSTAVLALYSWTKLRTALPSTMSGEALQLTERFSTTIISRNVSAQINRIA
jgi:hypothetical protein